MALSNDLPNHVPNRCPAKHAEPSPQDWTTPADLPNIVLATNL
jgi:hypothetical protein